MTVSLKHSTTASGSNNPNKQVSVDAWNDDHILTGNANVLIGTDSEGIATELTSSDIIVSNGVASVAGGNVVNNVASRTALAAITGAAAGHSRYLAESGREGTFVFSSANLATQVTADTAQGIYVAPSSDTTGASGAWVRKYDGPVWFHWFGGVQGDASGANKTANNTAWAGMYALVKALRTNATSNWAGLIPVRFGPGTYEFGATHDLTDGAIDYGGMGLGHGPATSIGATTKLKFYDCTGIRIQENNTSGASTKDGVAHNSSLNSHVHDFGLEGNFSGTEAEYHGIHARATFIATNVNIRNFAGDGVCLDADSSTVGGNATNWRTNNVTIWNCRDGYRGTGNNTGAGVATGGGVRVNRRWGINDGGSVGSTWVGVSIAQNGINAENTGVSIGAAMVSSGGNRYGAISGQETGASTNAPSGTTADNTWWYYIGAGGATTGIPAWSSGMLVRAGGPATTAASLGARSAFIGCYAESSGTLKAQISQTAIVVGGYLADTVFQNPTANMGTALLKGSSDGALETATQYLATNGVTSVRVGNTRGGTTNIVSASHSTVAPTGTGYGLIFDSGFGDVLLTYNGSNASSVYSLLLSGQSTADQFGTGAAQVNTIYMPRLAVGDVGYTRGNARRIFIDTAAPGSGAHGQGEYVFDRSSDTTIVARKCTTAGTPGTWSTLYGMTAAKSTGWAAWTGTANRATKDTATATTADIAQTLKALIDDLTTRGVIGP